MKVVYILSSPKALGGASKAFKTMLTGLMQRGVEPLVVIPGHGLFEEVLDSMHVPTLSMTYRFATYPSWSTWKDWLLFVPRLLARSWVNSRAVRVLVHTLQGKGVALIHTNVGVVDIGYRTARRLGIPHIYHIREYADLDFGLHYFPSKQRFRQILMQPFVYSICITRGIQQHHSQNHSRRSRVIYDGIRPAVPVCPPMAQGAYLLYAGRIEYTKGLDMLLQAYHLCRQQGTKLAPLWVAGRVEEKDYMTRMQTFVLEHHLTDWVHFLGERSDMESLMRGAYALVVPSRYEGFGLCMPEAMFCGCPVIAHDTAGTHEQLENGLQLTGQEIAFRFQTLEQLAQRLIELFTAGANSDMIHRAFNVVNQLYTTESHVAQVHQFYIDIMNEKGGPSDESD